MASDKKEYRAGSYPEPEIVEEAILVGSKALEKAPKIYPVPTGVEGLDELFFSLLRLRMAK